MLDLYSFHMSPFCRSVILTLKMLDVKHNYHNIDMSKDDQFKAEFLKVIRF